MVNEMGWGVGEVGVVGKKGMGLEEMWKGKGEF